MKDAEPRGILIERIRKVIAHLLGKEPPSIRAAARAAAMSVRTFQRRLADEDLTYLPLPSDR